MPVRNPSRASVTLRLTWLIQQASGSAVMPAISTRGRQLDEEEHGKSRQAATGPDVDVEEVGGGEDVPVGFQELRPRRLLRPLGRGFQAVFAEDVGDGAVGGAWRLSRNQRGNRDMAVDRAVTHSIHR